MSVFFSKDNLAARWSPRLDVYRCDEGWIIKVDAAGIRIEDTSVRVSGRLVRIAGVRRDRTLERGWHHYSMEISYTSFERVVELPCKLSSTDVRTECRDGMLLIHVRTES